MVVVPMLRRSCDTPAVTTPTSEPDDFLADLHAVRARLAATRPLVEAGDPWPLAARFDHAPESAWGPPEVLAHIVEMLGYWRVEFEKIAAGSADGSAVPFGRIATDATRLSNIERERTLPIGDLYRAVDDGMDRFTAAWTRWTPEERQRLGAHPTRGEDTIEAFARRFIVSHTTEHLDQLDGILAGTT